MSRLKVLVFGGRNYSDRTRLFSALDLLKQRDGEFAVINGGATGADSLGAEWGHFNGHPVITIRAPWDYFKRTTGSPKPAGHVRNGWMLELCAPNLAVMCPGGAGTADMLSKCVAAGVPVWSI